MSRKRPRISVLIIARNEEKNLPACLATLGWADEVVVVVDQSSRDRTLAIAKARADVVFSRKFVDFASQRNAALEAATGEWVFSIDADERVPSELASEILRAVANRNAKHSGYRIPIRSIILGRHFSYSGTQNDLPVRLFRRNAGRWIGQVHEIVELRGSTGRLSHALHHQTLPNVYEFLHKLNKYTTLEAQQYHRQGRPVRLTDLTIRPFWTFAKLYMAKQGFRDGPEGFLFCALSGVSVAVRHWKHRELVRGQTRGRAA